MRPVAALHEGGRDVVVHRCEACGAVRRNRAAAYDDPEAVLALFGRPVPDATGGRDPSG
jgi:predicted kinase